MRIIYWAYIVFWIELLVLITGTLIVAQPLTDFPDDELSMQEKNDAMNDIYSKADSTMQNIRLYQLGVHILATLIVAVLIILDAKKKNQTALNGFWALIQPFGTLIYRKKVDKK